MKKYKKYFALIFAFLILPSIAFAASFNDCRDIENAESATQLCNAIVEIGNILGIVAIAIAVIMIIIGGIKYITAGDDEEKTKSGKKTIINGLIGAAIVGLASFIMSVLSDYIYNRFV